MTERCRLPNRRASESFTLEVVGLKYVATVSYFPGTDQLAEIFLTNHRAGSDAGAAACDSAVVCSIALQHGVSPGCQRCGDALQLRQHCRVCGKSLSAPQSITRGIGSECRQGVLEVIAQLEQ